MSESRKMNKKDHKKKNKGDLNPTLCDIVTEQSLEKNYKILGKVDNPQSCIVLLILTDKQITKNSQFVQACFIFM